MLPWRPAAGLAEASGAPGRANGAELKYSIMKASHCGAQRPIVRAFCREPHLALPTTPNGNLYLICSPGPYPHPSMLRSSLHQRVSLHSA